METNNKKTKVTHKPHTIRFTDKAIDELKYRNNYNHRQNVRFIDGPPGVTLRWTPKTNKKIFQIEGKCKGHSFRMDIGQFYLGSYGTLEVNESYYLYLKNIRDLMEPGSLTQRLP